MQWPTQTTLSDGTVQISPLVIGIDNNALGQQVVGANENSVQPVREALVNALLSANCNFATELTVGDIGMGVLSGGGNLNLDFGGASAETDDLAATSPFGTGRHLAALVVVGRRERDDRQQRRVRSAASTLPVDEQQRRRPAGLGAHAPARLRRPPAARRRRGPAGVPRADDAHVGLHQPRPVGRRVRHRATPPCRSGWVRWRWW